MNKLTHDQLKFLRTVEKIGIENIITDTTMTNTFKMNGDDDALPSQWRVQYVKNWIDEYIERGFYDKNGTDRYILNSIREYYINYRESNYGNIK
jgi:hypothetical protein